MRPQPLLTVSDVEAASRWYQQLLGLKSDHGGDEYERLTFDGALVLQLHHSGVEHHHGATGDPDRPLGNGMLVWFETDDLDPVVDRVREMDVEVVHDRHVNPNARHHEIWVRDLDGYTVVVADPDGSVT
jgi:catechol 2,3-dioxygenase-like lactoylglutathione lyase family enzyme